MNSFKPILLEEQPTCADTDQPGIPGMQFSTRILNFGLNCSIFQPILPKANSGLSDSMMWAGFGLMGKIQAHGITDTEEGYGYLHLVFPSYPQLLNVQRMKWPDFFHLNSNTCFNTLNLIFSNAESFFFIEENPVYNMLIINCH